MELREFEYLIALAEEKSISKAAERLYMAQSSLSQFLSQYESELGIKLFIRTPKGISPSHNGQIFIEHLRKITYDYQSAKNELWDNEHMQGGRVSIGISSFRGKRVLPKILKRFKELYPNVKIDVVEENSLVLEEILLEGNLDVAVIALPASKLKNEIRFLTRDEVFLIAPKNHPILEHCKERNDKKGIWVEPKTIVKYDLILSYHDTVLGNISRNLFQKHKLKYRALYDNITAEMAIDMASAGLGLAFTYASCIRPSDRYELIRVGKDGIFLDLGVAFPQAEYHSKASKYMEEVIREIYKQAES